MILDVFVSFSHNTVKTPLNLKTRKRGLTGDTKMMVIS